MPDSGTPIDPESKPHPAPIASSPPVLDYGTAASKYLDGNALVRLATYSDPFEAELVRAKLESEGVRCSLEGTALLGGIGGYGQAMRKLDIEVIEADAERARTILDQIAVQRGQRRRDPNVPETCPKCGTASVGRSRTRGMMTVLAFVVGFMTFNNVVALGLGCFVVGTYLLCTLDRAKWRCKSCGHRWQHIVTTDVQDPDDEDRVESDSDSDADPKPSASRGDFLSG